MIEKTKQILNYYKDVLENDLHLKFFFKEENYLQSDEDKTNEEFILYGMENIHAKKFFIKNIEKLCHLKATSKESDLSSIYNLYYSPIIIEYSYEELENQEVTLLISPFFIEINSKLNNPLEEIEEVEEIIKNNQKELYIKNIFSSEERNITKEIKLNPAMLIEPFELLTTDFYEKINIFRKKQSKNLNISSIQELFEFMEDYINILIPDLNYKFTTIDEYRKYFENYLKKSLNSLNIKKNVSVKKDNFVFLKNNTLAQIDETTLLKGLMQMYDVVEKEGIKENNLLNFIFKGNNYKYKRQTSTEKESNSQLIINLNKNNSLLKNHQGSLNIEYDLTTSQKYCLNIANSSLPIIPINGSPGTGKTSLLRAIVGDIAVKNALNLLDEVRKEKEYFSFKTPIVSFSTNNRALDNIVEGIVSAYDEIKAKLNTNEKVLAERWINPTYSFTYYDKNGKLNSFIDNINEMRLYVPKIRNSPEYNHSNPDFPIYGSSISNFSELINEVVENYNTYVYKYFEKMAHFSIFFKENLLRFTKEQYSINSTIIGLLKLSIELLGQEIEKNNKILEEKNTKLIKWTENKIEIIDLCTTLVIEYNSYSKNSFLELSEFKIKTKDEFENFKTLILESIKDANNQITNYEKNISLNNRKRIIETTKLENEKKEKEIELMNIYDKKLLDLSKQIRKIRKKILEKEKVFNEKNEINFSKELKKLNEKSSHMPFLKKLIYKLIHLKKEKLILNNKYFNLQNHKKKFIEKKLNTINTLKINKKTFLKKWYEEEILLLQEYFNKKTMYIKTNFELLNEELYIIFEKTMFNFKFTNIEDLKNKILNLEDNFRKIDEIKEKFFYDEYEETINYIYKDADSNIRTKSFLYSIHLQEAVLLLELFYKKINFKNLDKKIKCPNCGLESIVFVSRPEKNDKYECLNKCGFEYYVNEIYLIKRIPTIFEINCLFEEGVVNISGKSFSFKKKEVGNKIFWNIDYSNKKNYGRNFKYLSIFFPIVNTTCHSFGTTMPKQESSIDYLFIDEAGMVLSPYIVNLYTGKKAFIFGDEKQIEPIYPLNISSKHKNKINHLVEEHNEDNQIIYQTKQEEINKYLLRKNIKNQEFIEEIKVHQSVLNSSIMSLSNKSIHIKNKYLPTAKYETSDIWLKEHFRCRKNIINFSNKYIYNNSIIMLKQNIEKQQHLSILNHTFKQQSHPNGSKINKEEAILIIEDIKKRISQMEDNEKNAYLRNIGIISPYKEQSNLITQILNKDIYLKQLISGTVHKFQGSERNIIYLSTTIGEGDDCKNAFFNKIDKPNLINVAITRAKEEFILVGNKNSLSKNKDTLTYLLIKYIEENEKNS